MQRGIRIGFCGAGGTGKTTTVELLRQVHYEFNNLLLMKSASRIVYEQKDLTEEKCAKLSEPEKWALQADIFGIKVKQDDSHPNFIADRTLLDHWAYCLMYCGSYIPNDAFIAHEALVRKHMLAAYSHVFYFPWGYFEAPSDGVRQDLKAWQYAIDSLIVGRLVRWGVPAIEVPQIHGPEHRAEYIYEVVMNVKGNPEKTDAV